jgi:hypothetical protein
MPQLKEHLYEEMIFPEGIKMSFLSVMSEILKTKLSKN